MTAAGAGSLRPRSVDLSCYRLKRFLGGEEVTALEEFLNQEEQQLLSFGPYSGKGFEATLFLAPSHPGEPPWLEFLRDGFPALPTRRVEGVAALLVVRLRGSRSQIFALPFGAGGRFLLRSDAWERGFGIRTALNLIFPREAGDDGARLVSVDSKRRGPDTVRARQQASRATTFETFDVDRLRDVVNAATGSPVDETTWGRRVSGSDAFHFTAPDLRFDTVGDICRRVEAAHRRTDYREHFGWIDDIKPVTDPNLIDELEDEVLGILRGGETEQLGLGPAGIVDWERVRSFRYHFDAGAGITHPDMRIGDYLRGASKRVPLDSFDADSLRRRHVDAVDGDGNRVHRWTIWNCLSGELARGSQSYILDEGEFFLVTGDYMEELDAFLEAIAPSSAVLPGADARTREDEFIQAAVEENSDLLCLHEKLIRTHAATTSIEVCDLLSADRQLIHVKRHLGSRDLSHLFAQGYVSADLLQGDQEFRRAVKVRISHLRAAARFRFIDPAAFNASEFEVAYAILADWNGRTLSEAPFFSKINLRRAAVDLRRSGFRVACSRIQVS